MKAMTKFCKILPFSLILTLSLLISGSIGYTANDFKLPNTEQPIQFLTVWGTISGGNAHSEGGEPTSGGNGGSVTVRTNQDIDVGDGSDGALHQAAVLSSGTYNFTEVIPDPLSPGVPITIEGEVIIKCQGPFFAEVRGTFRDGAPAPSLCVQAGSSVSHGISFELCPDDYDQSAGKGLDGGSVTFLTTQTSPLIQVLALAAQGGLGGGYGGVGGNGGTIIWESPGSTLYQVGCVVSARNWARRGTPIPTTGGNGGKIEITCERVSDNGFLFLEANGGNGGRGGASNSGADGGRGGDGGEIIFHGEVPPSAGCEVYACGGDGGYGTGGTDTFHGGDGGNGGAGGAGGTCSGIFGFTDGGDGGDGWMGSYGGQGDCNPPGYSPGGNGGNGGDGGDGGPAGNLESSPGDGGDGGNGGCGGHGCPPGLDGAGGVGGQAGGPGGTPGNHGQSCGGYAVYKDKWKEDAGRTKNGALEFRDWLHGVQIASNVVSWITILTAIATVPQITPVMILDWILEHRLTYLWIYIWEHITEDTIDRCDEIIDDPPDMNYKEVFASQPFMTYPLVGSAINRALIDTFNNLSKQAVTLQAVLTTVERYDGALLANENKYILLQADALEEYSDIMVSSANESGKALDNLSHQINAIESNETISSELLSLQERLSAQGFTQDEIQHFKVLGASDIEIENFKNMLIDLDLSDFGLAIEDMKSACNDTISGYIYLSTWASNVIHRLELPHSSPVADSGGPHFGLVGSTIQFDGSDSYDMDGQIVSYLWQFGDGSMGTGKTTTYSYESEATYTAILIVNDNDELIDIDMNEVKIVGTRPGPMPWIPLLLLGD